MLVSLEAGAVDIVVTDEPTALAACVAYPDFVLLNFTGTDDDFAVDERLVVGHFPEAVLAFLSNLFFSLFKFVIFKFDGLEGNLFLIRCVPVCHKTNHRFIAGLVETNDVIDRFRAVHDDRMGLCIIKIIFRNGDLVEHLCVLLGFEIVARIVHAQACLHRFAGFFAVDDHDRDTVYIDDPGIRHFFTCRINRVGLCEHRHANDGETDEQDGEQQCDSDLSLLCSCLSSTEINHDILLDRII